MTKWPKITSKFYQWFHALPEDHPARVEFNVVSGGPTPITRRRRDGAATITESEVRRFTE